MQKSSHADTEAELAEWRDLAGTVLSQVAADMGDSGGRLAECIQHCLHRDTIAP